MQAEILSVGDELSSGQQLDTNSQWLSQQLGDLGVRVMFHTTIGDDLQANIDALRIASQRVDLVICTGGLGPTADDLTRDAFAKAFDRPLQLDLASLQHIEQLFSHRKRPMPERNRVQAYFPEGAVVVPNPHGTAPGIDLTLSNPSRSCRLFALPGVPAEMKEMFLGTIVPRLVQSHGLGASKVYHRSIKLFGIGESDVESKLPSLIARDRVPRVGITVHQATIKLNISTEAANQQEADSKVADTVSLIYSELDDFVFGEGDVELQHVVIDQLIQRQETMAVLEVGPRATMAAWLLSVDRQAPHRVSFALQLRTLNELRRFAKLEPISEEQQGSSWLDEPIATDLITRVHASLLTDWILLLATYPEQGNIGNQQAMPTWSFAVAISGPGIQFVRHFDFGAHPDVLYDRIAKTGLDQLRRTLARDSSNDGAYDRGRR